jgi:hypothetical protein
MNVTELDRITTQLASVYGQTIKVGQEGQRRLLQIEGVELYPGCQPPQTTMLVVLDPGHPKPQVFVTPGQHLANGRLPKNNSNILIAGQTWMQFSFNIPWSDGDNIMRFVAAARQRFAQNE